MKELGNQEAKYFARVDDVNRSAVVTLDPEKRDEIVAVVRFDRQGNTDKGEYAALVEDRWQRRELGLAMTHQLIDEARDRGIRYHYGLVIPENAPMLKLIRGLDLPRREYRDEGTEYVEVRGDRSSSLLCG